MVDVDAGKVFQKLTHVAVGNIAKDIGGNRGGDVHVAPLRLHGLGIAFALGRNGKGLQLHGTIFLGRGRGRCAREIDLRAAIWPAVTVKDSFTEL